MFYNIFTSIEMKLIFCSLHDISKTKNMKGIAGILWFMGGLIWLVYSFENESALYLAFSVTCLIVGIVYLISPDEDEKLN